MTCTPATARPLLQRAGVLLARADDGSWDELLALLQQVDKQCVPTWRAVALATLEALVARRACETLARDPWSSVAPLITELLHGFARHIPADLRRGVRAVDALFIQLAALEPITWPDGLPGAVVALCKAWAGAQRPLVAALARALDRARLCELLACQRTTRRELRSLRPLLTDVVLLDGIDAALGASRILPAAA